MAVDVKNGPGGRGSNDVEICTPSPQCDKKDVRTPMQARVDYEHEALRFHPFPEP
jgi:hypothetical protein